MNTTEGIGIVRKKFVSISREKRKQDFITDGDKWFVKTEHDK